MGELVEICMHASLTGTGALSQATSLLARRPKEMPFTCREYHKVIPRTR